MLPVPLTPLVGRADDVVRFDGLLGSHRLVTIVGMGGAGKTRLATAIGHAWVDRVDRVVFVDCTNASDDSGVLAAFGVALSIPAQNVDTSSVVRALLGSSVLVVVDNCEQAVRAVSALVHTVLAACGDARVLATSRVPLGVDGEQAALLGPLGQPDLGATDPTLIRSAPAVRLLLDRVPVGWEETAFAASAVDVARICRRVDGLPLGIELAAARLRTHSAAQVADSLESHFTLLRHGSRTAPARHRTMSACLDWSIDLLDRSSVLVLRRCSVFTDVFGVDAAAAVVGDEMSAAEVVDSLDALVDASLVVPAGDGGFRLLETVRTDARIRLREAGEGRPTADRHARELVGRYFQAVNQGVIPSGLSSGRDVEAALEHCEDIGDHELLVTLACLAWTALSADASPRTVYWCRRALELDPPAEMRGYLLSAVVFHASAADVRAVPELDELLSLTQDSADPGLLATALSAWSNLLAITEGPTRALERAEELSEIVERFGPSHAAGARRWTSVLHALRGDLDRASEVLSEAGLSVDDPAETDGDRMVVALWAHALVLLGRAREAHELVSVEDPKARATAAVVFADVDGWALCAMGDPQAGKARAARGPMPVGVQLSAGLALCRMAAGDSEQVVDWIIAEARALGDRPYELHGLRATAAVAAARAGRRDDVVAILDALSSAAAKSPEPLTSVTAHLAAAGVAWCQGDDPIPAARRCLEAMASSGIAYQLADLLALLGANAVDNGRAAHAATFFALADAATSGGAGPFWDPAWTAAARDVAATAAGPEHVPDDLAGIVSRVLTMTDAQRSRSRATFGWDSLTPAELRVAALVAEGMTNAEAAASLGVATSTVSSHVKSTFVKLGINARAALAREFVAHTRD